jgi:hypothetical protein
MPVDGAHIRVPFGGKQYVVLAAARQALIPAKTVEFLS